jgi:cell division protein FtsL
MNAAARLVHQEAITRQLIYVQFLTRQQWGVMFLGLMVVVSALSVIYVTHLTRELHANYEQNMADRNHLHIERGQLLLERSTQMVQSRIQQIAEKQLGMVLPNHKSVVIVHE